MDRIFSALTSLGVQADASTAAALLHDCQESLGGCKKQYRLAARRRLQRRLAALGLQCKVYRVLPMSPGQHTAIQCDHAERVIKYGTSYTLYIL